MHHAGVAEWHPILAARETRPGYWRMIDPSGREYGTIELVRTGSDAGALVRYALVAIAIGGALIVGTRRRTPSRAR